MSSEEKVQDQEPVKVLDPAISSAFVNRYGSAVIDDGLDKVLRDPSCYVELFEVASELFADETVRFFRALLFFKQQTDDQGRRAHAMWMCDAFVAVDSPHEVNVDGPTREALMETHRKLQAFYDGELEEPPPVPSTLFDDLANQVKNSIRETFYKNYKSKVETRERSLGEMFEGFNYGGDHKPRGIYGTFEVAPEELDDEVQREEYLQRE